MAVKTAHICPVEGHWTHYEQSVTFLEDYRSGRLLSQHNDVFAILYDATRAVENMEAFINCLELQSRNTANIANGPNKNTGLQEDFAAFEYQLGEYRAFLEVLKAARTEILRMASYICDD